MTSVYIDYPEKKFHVQHGRTASSRFKHEKVNRRVMHLDLANLSDQLKVIVDNEMPFAANEQNNDLWLDIDLGDTEFELSVARFIHFHLGKRYRPIREADFRVLSSE